MQQHDAMALIEAVTACRHHGLSRIDECLELSAQRPYLDRIKPLVSAVLPSYLAALRSLPPIPKLLHACWRDRAIVDSSNSPLVAHGLRRMRALNPEWTFKIWEDAEMEEYIRSSSLVRRADYHLIRRAHIVEKSDLFRLLLLYQEGGFYQDIDRPYNRALRDVISNDTRLLLPLFDFDFVQDLMCTSPRNPLFLRAIELNLERRRELVPRRSNRSGFLEAHDVCE